MSLGTRMRLLNTYSMYPECNYRYINSIGTTPIYPQGTGQFTATAARIKLHTIVFGNTLAGTVTLKDNNTTVAVFAVGTLASSYIFDSVFGSGITVVTTAADNITVNWTTH